jgi:hypothetical protein
MDKQTTQEQRRAIWRERSARSQVRQRKVAEARRWKAVFDLAFEEAVSHHVDERPKGYHRLVDCLFKLMPACEKASER